MESVFSRSFCKVRWQSDIRLQSWLSTKHGGAFVENDGRLLYQDVRVRRLEIHATPRVTVVCCYVTALKLLGPVFGCSVRY